MRCSSSAASAGSRLRTAPRSPRSSCVACCRSRAPMNLIEEAAKRLQELEKAGIRVPATQPAGQTRPASADAEPIPQRVARAALQPAPRALAPATSPAVDARLEPTLEQKTPDAPNYRNIDLARLQGAGFITPSVRESKLLHEF